jgi:hypothetical protein
MAVHTAGGLNYSASGAKRHGHGGARIVAALPGCGGPGLKTSNETRPDNWECKKMPTKKEYEDGVILRDGRITLDGEVFRNKDSASSESKTVKSQQGIGAKAHQTLD